MRSYDRNEKTGLNSETLLRLYMVNLDEEKQDRLIAN